MKITEFINMYEEATIKKIELPNVKAKDIKKYLNIFNNAFQRNRNIEGRAMFMKFLSDLGYLYNNLHYAEMKDSYSLEISDINDAKVFYKNVMSFVKSKDDIIDRLKLRKQFNSFVEKIKKF